MTCVASAHPKGEELHFPYLSETSNKNFLVIFDIFQGNDSWRLWFIHTTILMGNMLPTLYYSRFHDYYLTTASRFIINLDNYRKVNELSLVQLPKNFYKIETPSLEELINEFYSSRWIACLKNEIIIYRCTGRFIGEIKRMHNVSNRDWILVKSAFEHWFCWSSCVITIEQLNRNRNSTATELSSTSLTSNGGFH